MIFFLKKIRFFLGEEVCTVFDVIFKLLEDDDLDVRNFASELSTTKNRLALKSN